MSRELAALRKWRTSGSGILSQQRTLSVEMADVSDLGPRKAIKMSHCTSEKLALLLSAI